MTVLSARLSTIANLDIASRIDVEFSLSDDVLVVAITGEVDILSAPELLLALGDALTNAPLAAVLDLTGISFIGTAGLAVLTEFHHTARDHGLDWAMAASHAVLRPLQAAGLDLPAHADMHEALARLKPGSPALRPAA